jgi:hypothetical protein
MDLPDQYRETVVETAWHGCVCQALVPCAACQQVAERRKEDEQEAGEAMSRNRRELADGEDVYASKCSTAEAEPTQLALESLRLRGAPRCRYVCFGGAGSG